MSLQSVAMRAWTLAPTVQGLVERGLGAALSEQLYQRGFPRVEPEELTGRVGPLVAEDLHRLAIFRAALRDTDRSLQPALDEVDPEVAGLLDEETRRQQTGVTLIASENHASAAVREALRSPANDKYAEGYPGARYYPGNGVIDNVERLAIERFCRLFGAEHANVQPDSGAVANVAALHACRMALQERLRPSKEGPERQMKILSQSLPHGGHLSHGWPVTKVGKDNDVRQYGVRREDHHLDMAEVARMAREFGPDVIIAGFSGYSGKLDFAAYAEIAAEVGAYFVADIAHVAGLVAADVYPDPVPYADIVTFTTHKTFRGPRGAVILSKKDDRLHPDAKTSLAQWVDRAIFPGIQGGPHEHAIAAKAVAALEASQPAFVQYANLVLSNALAMYEVLTSEGLSIPFGPPEDHLMLVDVTPLGTSGKPASALLESVGIFANMNAIPFDPRKPFDPSGLRLGTPAISTRGFSNDETRELARLMAETLRSQGDEGTLRRVTGRIHELALARPVYHDWLTVGPNV